MNSLPRVPPLGDEIPSRFFKKLEINRIIDMSKTVEMVFSDLSEISEGFHGKELKLHILYPYPLITQTRNLTRLEKEIDRICELSEKESLTFGELFAPTAPQDQALVSLLLSLPFLLPIPLPGLSTPFGLAICFVSGRMLLGLPFWLPSFLFKKNISPTLIGSVFSKLKPWVTRSARYIKPRGTFFSKHPGNKFFSSLLIFVGGILLALPLPPGTNAPPALTVVCFSLGLLEEDSLFLFLGYLIFGLIVSFLVVAFWFGFWYVPAP